MLLKPGQWHRRISHRAQRACYVALRRNGWRVEQGVLSVSAYKDGREEGVTAQDYRELLDKCSKLDAAETKRSRPKPFTVSLE